MKVRSERVVRASSMTRNLLGGAVASGCVPYWRHEFGPLKSALGAHDARLLTQMVWPLAPTESLPILLCYMAKEGLPGKTRLLAERTYERGWLLRRQRTLLALACAEPADFAELLRDAWSASANETMLVVIGEWNTIRGYVETTFVDDVEANPVNEEGLIPLVGAVLARGWDGLSATMFSRNIDPELIQASVRILRATS